MSENGLRRHLTHTERQYLEAMGEELRTYRSGGDIVITQAELAAVAHVAPLTIYRLESGQRRVTRKTLERITLGLTALKTHLNDELTTDQAVVWAAEMYDDLADELGPFAPKQLYGLDHAEKEATLVLVDAMRRRNASRWLWNPGRHFDRHVKKKLDAGEITQEDADENLRYLARSRATAAAIKEALTNDPSADVTKILAEVEITADESPAAGDPWPARSAVRG
jgi:transcriptional regulator with XRE-family HTH domain